jgi:hypothetical protein
MLMREKMREKFIADARNKKLQMRELCEKNARKAKWNCVWTVVKPQYIVVLGEKGE